MASRMKPAPSGRRRSSENAGASSVRRRSKFGDCDEEESSGTNPFGNTASQKYMLRKGISGEAVDGGRHADSQMDISTNRDFSQLGLMQQHERLVDADYVGTEEYQNKRMRLAAAMDSIYVNAIIICIVFADVISIAFYELQDAAAKDCFGRDFPVQEVVTLCCLSGYVIELLLRGFGNGWRQSYSFKSENANTIFDGAVVAVSIAMGVYKTWSDRSQKLDCPEEWMAKKCPNFENFNTCSVPSRPYTLDIDDKMELCRRLCDFGASTGGDVKTARAITTGTRTVSLAVRVIRAIRMLLKARRVTSQLSRAMRARHSKGIRRYTKLGFDLDLSYITTRMICMAAPGINQMKAHAVDGDIVGLNDAVMLARFLATRHYDNFRAFNFCAEEIGSYAIQRLFGQVLRVPIKDRQPPLLTEVLILCENAAHYLFLDESKVVLLHCNSGRDRTGVFAAAFLLYSGHCSSAKEAMDLFSMRRIGRPQKSEFEQHTMRGASLIRMLQYVEAVIDGKETFSPVELMLCGIEIKGLSMKSFSKTGRSIQISCGAMMLLDSSDKGSQVTMSKTGVSFPPIVICGDTRVAIFSTRGAKKTKAATDKVPDFFLHFHTAFVSGRKRVTFSKLDLDFVAQSQDSYPSSLELVTCFSNQDSKGLHMINAFRSLVKCHGRIKSFDKGNVVVPRGDLVPAIRMVLSGHISQLVPSRQLDETGLITQKAEVSTVAIFGPGQMFAFSAVAAGLPDCRYMCTSRSCEIVELELERLVEKKDSHADHARQHKSTAPKKGSAEPSITQPGQDNSQKDFWHFPGISKEELPGFCKVFAQLLSQQCLLMHRTQQVSSKDTSFNDEVDTMMHNVGLSAIQQFKLPAHEECSHVHRCEVFDTAGTPLADRVVFLTNYIILDTQMRGDTIKSSSENIFDLELLTAAHIMYPDISIIAFTLGGMEYEARCGKQAHAKDFIARLDQVMSARYVLFRRLALQSRAKPDKYGNFLPEMTSFLEITPKVMLKYNETASEAGGPEQSVIFVMSGTLMQMDGTKIVKVLQPGQFVGLHEYLLNIRTQFTSKVRSKEGAWIVRIPKSLLDAQLKSRPETAASFFRCMAKQSASDLYLMLITQRPTAVFAYAQDIDPTLDSDGKQDEEHEEDPGDHQQEETDNQSHYTRDLKMVKLLKLRKSEFLKHIDCAGINLLASGMRSMKLSRNSILMNQGDKVRDNVVDSMYLVKSGILNIFVDGMDPDNIVRTLGKGEIVGERALLLQEDRSATVQAKTACTVGVIGIEQLQELVTNNPQLVKILKDMYKGKVILGLTASLQLRPPHAAQPPSIQAMEPKTHEGPLLTQPQPAVLRQDAVLGVRRQRAVLADTFEQSQSSQAAKVQFQPEASVLTPSHAPAGAPMVAHQSVLVEKFPSYEKPLQEREGNTFIPEPNLSYRYDTRDYSASTSRRSEAGGHVGEQPAPYYLQEDLVAGSQQVWLGAASEERLVELAQLGAAMGIAPPTESQCGEFWST